MYILFMLVPPPPPHPQKYLRIQNSHALCCHEFVGHSLVYKVGEWVWHVPKFLVKLKEGSTMSNCRSRWNLMSFPTFSTPLLPFLVLEVGSDNKFHLLPQFDIVGPSLDLTRNLKACQNATIQRVGVFVILFCVQVFLHTCFSSLSCCPCVHKSFLHTCFFITYLLPLFSLEPQENKKFPPLVCGVFI
jgi:hypothetical protein